MRAGAGDAGGRLPESVGARRGAPFLNMVAGAAFAALLRDRLAAPGYVTMRRSIAMGAAMPTSRVHPDRAVGSTVKPSARKPPAAKAKTTGPAGAADPVVRARPTKSRSTGAEFPSELIDAKIAELGDWRGELLARLRALIKAADPEVVEEWKWMGVPVWSHDGLICTGETYKKVVKMTFARGAALPDPAGLFNSSLEGNVRRAIDFHEGEAVNEAALTALIRAAVALNQSSGRGK